MEEASVKIEAIADELPEMIQADPVFKKQETFIIKPDLIEIVQTITPDIITNQCGQCPPEKKIKLEENLVIIEEQVKMLEKNCFGETNLKKDEETHFAILGKLPVAGVICDKKSDTTIEEKEDNSDEHIEEKDIVESVTSMSRDESIVSTKKTSTNKRKSAIKKSKRRTVNKLDVSSFQLEPVDSKCLFVMGVGDAGQLGLGPDVSEVVSPTLVKIKSVSSFKHVVCGGMHTIALTSRGNVYTCGCNDEGALGRVSSSISECSFLQVDFPKSVLIKKVTAGDSHSAALSSNGVVYAWGTFRDSKGPIGLIKAKQIVTSPVVIYSQKDECVDVCSGNNHILILTRSGRLFSCGCGDQGQLGRIPERKVVSRGGREGLKHLTLPKEVFILGAAKRSAKGDPNVGRVVQISAGKCSSIAHLHNGLIYGFGLNNYRQLSSKSGDCIFFPLPLDDILKTCTDDINGLDLVITGGVQHTLILNVKSGIIYSVGDHNDGRLGRSDLQNKACKDMTSDDTSIKPVDISSSSSVKFIKCACGDACSFAISSDSKLYAWGLGCNNQLGVGEEKDIYIPTLVTSESICGKEISEISSGAQHSAILSNS